MAKARYERKLGLTGVVDRYRGHDVRDEARDERGRWTAGAGAGKQAAGHERTLDADRNPPPRADEAAPPVDPPPSAEQIEAELRRLHLANQPEIMRLQEGVRNFEKDLRNPKLSPSHRASLERALAECRENLSSLIMKTYGTAPIGDLARGPDLVARMKLMEKLGAALRKAIESGQLSEDVRAKLEEILQPSNLAMMATIAAAYGAAHATPLAPGLAVVDAYMLGSSAAEVGNALFQLYLDLDSATTQQELNEAATSLSKLLAGPVADALMKVVVVGAGKGVGLGAKGFNKRFKIQPAPKTSTGVGIPGFKVTRRNQAPDHVVSPHVKGVDATRPGSGVPQTPAPVPPPLPTTKPQVQNRTPRANTQTLPKAANPLSRQNPNPRNPPPPGTRPPKAPPSPQRGPQPRARTSASGSPVPRRKKPHDSSQSRAVGVWGFQPKRITGNSSDTRTWRFETHHVRPFNKHSINIGRTFGKPKFQMAMAGEGSKPRRSKPARNETSKNQSFTPAHSAAGSTSGGSHSGGAGGTGSASGKGGQRTRRASLNSGGGNFRNREHVLDAIKLPEAHPVRGHSSQDFLNMLPRYLTGAPGKRDNAHGILVVNGRFYKISSGGPNARAGYTQNILPPDSFHHFPGFSHRNHEHLESGASAILHKLLHDGERISHATLYMNMRKMCGRQWGCYANITSMLPSGVQLDVVGTRYSRRHRKSIDLGTHIGKQKGE